MIEFRQLANDEPALAFSPLLRGFTKTFEYLAEHGSIGLTASKAFKRNFVHWAAAEFEWPGHTKEDLFAINKVLNEDDFLPLGDIHFLMTTLKIGRHYKGQFKLTKAGADLVGNPGRLFGIITPFYLFEIDHTFFMHWDNEQLLGNWDIILNVLNVEAEDGITGADLRFTLYGPPASGPDQIYDRVMARLYLDVLRPLCWTGLLQMTRAAGSMRTDKSVFAKTPLWKAALKLDTDNMVQTATRH